MNATEKALAAGVLMIAIGVAIYEARRAAEYESEIQALRREQASLTEQMARESKERNAATNCLSAAVAENQQLRQWADEVAKLRNQITQLRAVLLHPNTCAHASA